MRVRVFLCLFFALSARVFSETLPVLLPAPHSASSSVVTVPLEWNEKWFGEKPSTVYNHNLARVACYFSDAAYSAVKEQPTDNHLFDAYKKLGIKESDIEAHYDIDYSDSLWGNDQCAFSIASKKIQSSHGLQTLLLVVIRGTPLNANEWLSNLNINDAAGTQDVIHKGFARAASVVHTALISYMLRRQINPTDAFLLMTGHSRGAAVSNLLSAILLEDKFFKCENMYTYTFAAPNVTTRDDASGEIYGFIWNIVNTEDVVPTVPMNRENWKFRKFGHTLAFSNPTNTDRTIYIEEFMPKINAIYERLSGREYSPFRTGPFIPILVTKLVLFLSEDVETFYSGAIALHSKASSLMNTLFPEKPVNGEEQAVEEKSSRLGSWFYSWLNNRLGGNLSYISQAFGDMHSNDVYLSYMLALEESEVFSDVGYSIVIVKGYEEFAVFDSEGNMLARVFDGKISRSDTKLPVLLSPSFGNKVVVGYPANLDFDIVVTDEALLPTPAYLTAEFFDAAGIYQGSEQKKIHVRRNVAYQAALGKTLLERGELSFERLSASEGRKIIDSAELRPQRRFKVTPELTMNTDFNLGLALHIGKPLFFTSLMVGQGLTKLGKSAEVALGFGNQQTLYSQLKFENEIFGKVVFLRDSDVDDSVIFVPEFRSSLSLKVIGRIRIFSAGAFDFRIENFNDTAFKTSRRRTTIESFRITNSVRAAPSVQFGIRF